MKKSVLSFIIITSSFQLNLDASQNFNTKNFLAYLGIGGGLAGTYAAYKAYDYWAKQKLHPAEIKRQQEAAAVLSNSWHQIWRDHLDTEDPNAIICAKIPALKQKMKAVSDLNISEHVSNLALHVWRPKFFSCQECNGPLSQKVSHFDARSDQSSFKPTRGVGLAFMNSPCKEMQEINIAITKELSNIKQSLNEHNEKVESAKRTCKKVAMSFLTLSLASAGYLGWLFYKNK